MLGDFSSVFPFDFFKTDEQKKAEYEKEIATNVAAMEVQNRLNEGSAYSNDPRFQEPIGPAAVDPGITSGRNFKGGPNSDRIKNTSGYGGGIGSLMTMTPGLTPSEQNLINIRGQAYSPQQQINLRQAENTNPAGNISQAALQKGFGLANVNKSTAPTQALTGAGGGMDYMTLLKILGMMQGGNQNQSNVKPGITPGITPGVAGNRIEEQDLYARNRR